MEAMSTHSHGKWKFIWLNSGLNLTAYFSHSPRVENFNGYLVQKQKVLW